MNGSAPTFGDPSMLAGDDLNDHKRNVNQFERNPEANIQLGDESEHVLLRRTS